MDIKVAVAAVPNKLFTVVVVALIVVILLDISVVFML